MDDNAMAGESIQDRGTARLRAGGRRLDHAFAALGGLAAGAYASCMRRASSATSPPGALLDLLPEVRWIIQDDHPLTWVEPDHHLLVHQAWMDAREGDDRVGRALAQTTRPLVPADGTDHGAPGWHQVTVVDLTGVAGIDVMVVALVPTAVTPDDAAALTAATETTEAPSWFRGTTSFRLRLNTLGEIEGGTLNVADVLGRPLVELLGRRVQELAHPDDVSSATAAWRQLIAGEVSINHARSRMRKADGAWRWFDTTSWNVLDVATVGAVIVEFRDVQEQVEAEEANEATSRAHTRLVRVFDEVDDMVMVGRMAGGLVYVNEAAAAVIGPDALGVPLIELLRPDLRALADSVVRPMMFELERWTGDVEIELDGQTRTMATTVTPVQEPDQDEIYYGVIMRDVTAERSHARALATQARRDPLTLLPNRLGLMEHLDRCRNGRPGSTVSVCFIDLDNLKVVNDGLGHSAGDRLLRAVGAQLLNQRGTVARFGGDEFVVVYQDLSLTETAAAAEQLLAAIRRVEVLGVASHVTASIGVASCRCDRLDPEAIIRDADAAMYVAKREGRSKVVHFDETMRSVVARRFVLESSLREALEEDGVAVHLQPVVSVADGRLTGFEALARWPSAAPDEFIPVAEESGLIVPLGRLALHRSLEALSRIRTQIPALEDLRIGVNVSGRQLLDPGFRVMVLAALAEHDVDPQHLMLELTESVLIDPGNGIAGVLQSLRDLGVSLALDDFGSGYSSLGYLRRYPIDVLKLDNSYTQVLLHDEGTRIIVEAVVTMAGRLGLQVVAEGVETEDQLAIVRDLGIDSAQGYLLGSPASLADTLDSFAVTTDLTGG